MKILGIETSCDDTAAAVIETIPPLSGYRSRAGFRVLSNVSYSQVAIHEKFGGIVPNLASRAHLEKIVPTVKGALLSAGLKTPTPRQVGGRGSDQSVGVDLIAVTRGPGLLPSLLIGVNFARALAYKWQKPIIGVNHIEGHIYSNWLLSKNHLSSLAFLVPPSERDSGTRPRSVAKGDHRARFGLVTRSERTGDFFLNPKKIFPALILIVSGGHTELILMRDYGKYKIIGETMDDAAGECFDKTARILGLEFPGGPFIAQLADKWENKLFRTQILPIGQKCVLTEKTNNKQIKLPRPMINSKDYNFSFSGLKTAVLYQYNYLAAQDISRDVMRSAMAFEIQEAIVDVLIAKTLKAVKNFNPKSVMVAGGVSANKRLREKMAEKITPYKIPLLIPDLVYTTDNAAMIAASGYFNYIKRKPKQDSWKKITADANLRL